MQGIVSSSLEYLKKQVNVVHLSFITLLALMLPHAKNSMVIVMVFSFSFLIPCFS